MYIIMCVREVSLYSFPFHFSHATSTSVAAASVLILAVSAGPLNTYIIDLAAVYFGIITVTVTLNRQGNVVLTPGGHITFFCADTSINGDLELLGVYVNDTLITENTVISNVQLTIVGQFFLEIQNVSSDINMTTIKCNNSSDHESALLLIQGKWHTPPHVLINNKL